MREQRSAMGSKRKRILAAMALGAIYAGGILWYGAGTGIGPGPGESRLAFVFGWLLWPGLTLLAGIGRLAAARFFDDSTIDGEPPRAKSPMEIDLRYLQNTLEQVVLAAVCWSALALRLPAEQLGVVPVLAISFVLARLCFWIGYHRSGPARAFGFAATFYPTVATALWAAGLHIAAA